MEHLKRAYQALASLARATDRSHPDCPREPAKPREPIEIREKTETIQEAEYSLSLSDLVETCLKKASIDVERIPEDIRAALELVRVEATRNRHDDLVLEVDWVHRIPNPQYAEERAVFLTEMMAYEKACEQYADKVEAYVARCNEGHRIVTEMRERAEYERLKDKFEKKGT